MITRSLGPGLKSATSPKPFERHHRAGFEPPAAAACALEIDGAADDHHERVAPVLVDVRAPVARGDRDDAP